MSLPLTSRTTSLRDKVAMKLANLMLGMATPRYRMFIRGVITYGLDSAARDARENQSAPPHWEVTP